MSDTPKKGKDLAILFAVLVVAVIVGAFIDRTLFEQIEVKYVGVLKV